MNLQFNELALQGDYNENIACLDSDNGHEISGLLLYHF